MSAFGINEDKFAAALGDQARGLLPEVQSRTSTILDEILSRPIECQCKLWGMVLFTFTFRLGAKP